MSEKSTPGLIELTQRGFDAAGRGDLDATMSLFAQDAVYVTERFGRFEGRAAIRRYFEDWFGSFDDLSVELTKVSDLGNGVVFALQVVTGRHGGSSVEVQLRNAVVYLFVDGLIVRSSTHVDIDEARAVAQCLAEERG